MEVKILLVEDNQLMAMGQLGVEIREFMLEL